MGLSIRVAMFQKVADYVLRDVRDIAAVYVDYILIGTGWQELGKKCHRSNTGTSDEC